jgi:hypothetical protein
MVDSDPMAGDNADQIVQIDLPRLIEVLRRGLPEGDPTPAYLARALRRLKEYHSRLNDWKELHNQLNDILFNFGQFSREVERLAVYHEDPEPETIGIHWRPVSQKVAFLLDWASAPRSVVVDKPFARLEDGIAGPTWLVELCVASDRLDNLVHPAGPSRLFVLPRDSRPTRPLYVDINELYDAEAEFYDVAERSMYLAGRQLRETATELLNLSHIVLGSLEDE